MNTMNTIAERQVQFAAWLLAGVGRLDLAAATYEPTGKVGCVEQARAPLTGDNIEKMLAWARARNAHGAQVWVRPAAELAASPFLMLDDVRIARAMAVPHKYAAAVIETSPGNAQVWLRASRHLTREQRQDVLRSLCRLIGSDPGAISEPRWGRMPGFRDRKPGRSGWTNTVVLAEGRQFDPSPHLAAAAPAGTPAATGFVARDRGAKRDESRAEFCFAARALRRGVPVETVIERVARHALDRGKRRGADDARLYAARTVARAQAQIPAM